MKQISCAKLQLGNYLYSAKGSGIQPVTIYTETDNAVIDSKEPETDKADGQTDDGKKTCQ